MVASSERIFCKTLSLEQIRASYRPCVKRREGYAPLLTAKISTEHGAMRFRGEQGVERRPPDDWRSARMYFRLHVSHLWIMNGGFGLIINVADAKVVSEGIRESRTTSTCPV